LKKKWKKEERNKSIFSTKNYAFVIFTFFILFSCSSDDPIATSGNISGTIKDASDSEFISDASISLSGESNQTTNSGSLGTYSFNSIPIGGYQLNISKIGYVSESKNVTVSADKNTSVSFSLVKKLPTANPINLELTVNNKEKSIELKNNYSGTMNFTVSTSKTWLTVSPSTGAIQSSNAVIIKVKADFTTLGLGTYEEKIIINVEGASLSIPIKVIYE